MKNSKPAHIVRASPEAGKHRRRKPPATPEMQYPPGYFTEPVRGENGRTWPPGWEPSVEGLRTKADDDRDAARAICMQRRVGFAAGGGTINLGGDTPKRGRPPNQNGY